MPPTKSLRSGTWASTLLPTADRPRTARCQRARGRAPKNSTTRRHPPLIGHGGDVGRRLDAEHRDPTVAKVLQQVAVVGGHLDHLAVRPGPAARSSARRSHGSARASLWSRRRNRRSRRRSAQASRTPRAARGSSCPQTNARSGIEGLHATRGTRARDRNWPAASCPRSAKTASEAPTEAANGALAHLATGPSLISPPESREPAGRPRSARRQRAHVRSVRAARDTSRRCSDTSLKSHADASQGAARERGVELEMTSSARGSCRDAHPHVEPRSSRPGHSSASRSTSQPTGRASSSAGRSSSRARARGESHSAWASTR